MSWFHRNRVFRGNDRIQMGQRIARSFMNDIDVWSIMLWCPAFVRGRSRGRASLWMWKWHVTNAQRVDLNVAQFLDQLIYLFLYIWYWQSDMACKCLWEIKVHLFGTFHWCLASIDFLSLKINYCHTNIESRSLSTLLWSFFFFFLFFSPLRCFIRSTRCSDCESQIVWSILYSTLQ